MFELNEIKVNNVCSLSQSLKLNCKNKKEKHIKIVGFGNPYAEFKGIILVSRNWHPLTYQRSIFSDVEISQLIHKTFDWFPHEGTLVIGQL